MKRILLTFFLTVMATVVLQAQQISVVSSGGSTKLYRTLKDAIEGAEGGSVIYLPGGGFPISDDVKITKKLTIIGIGHKSNNDNVDGITTISGNLFFNEGSSSSGVMGCYITGRVNVGHDGKEVNDILIRCCNLDGVYVINNNCQGTVINQNFIRNGCSFYDSNAYVTNNILAGFYRLQNGIVKNNIFIRGVYTSASGYANGYYAFVQSNNCIMINNIFVARAWGGSNTASNNIGKEDYGEDFINIGDIDWNNVFVNYNNGTISPASNFHFTEDYKQYENQVGIYAGTGFNDNQLAPVPYIVAKQVDQQTDTSGKLNIKIRVKAGQ